MNDIVNDIIVKDVVEDYWLSKPNLALSDDDIAAFEAVDLPASGVEVLDALELPKWRYFDWLSTHQDVVFHGSGNADIDVFEPRTPNDNSPDSFSKQTAVFASGDGLWAIFYAIVNRSAFSLRMLNSAHQIVDGNKLSSMLYYFSITDEVLQQQPWRTGMMYILPKASFSQMPRYDLQQRQVLEPHWASPKPVKPIAKVRILPEDFPFLQQIRGHDDAYVMAQSQRDPYGFPWLDMSAKT